jgi:two-component system CheB/CheR fusion protein
MKNSYNVLLIEDNPGDARLVKEMLKENNSVKINITTAQTLKESMDELFSNSYDVILLDLNLPDSNGIDTIYNIKKISDDIPIIVLTGLMDNEFSDKAISLYKVDDYLLKDELLPSLLIRTIKYVIERKEDIKKIEEERKKVKQYIDIAGVIIISMDKKGNIELANKMATELLSHNGDSIVGRNWFEEYIPPDLLNEVKRVFEGLIQGDETNFSYHENMILSPNYGERLIAWNNSFIKDENDEIVAVLSSGEDITQKKIIEQELRNKERSYKELYELAPSPYHSLGPDGKIIIVNQRWLDCMGYETSDEVIGKDFKEFLLPEYEKKYDESFERFKRKGKVDFLRMEVYKKNKIPIIISLNGTISYDEKGNMRQTHCIYTDITLFIKQNKELEENKVRLQNLVDNISDWIWEVDQNGVYTYVSPKSEEILGYKPEDMIGKTPFDFMPEGEAKKISQSFIEIIKNKLPIKQLENTNITKNGDLVCLETNANPILGKNGELLGYRGADRDITERKKSQQTLKEKEEIILTQSRHAAMGEMISMIAHQWRQPISTISMGANNILVDIELGTVDEESLKEEALTITDQTEFLSKTIDDFRDFFKPNKEKEYTQINSSIEDALNVVGKSLEHNNINIIKKLDCKISLHIFKRELLQVLINILKNAKEALIENKIENKKIAISTFEDEYNIIIEICDNAGGIKTDMINKIYEPYFTTKGEASGTGLGLYMSKTIVEKHLKGKIKTINKDQGACFRIILPVS